MEDHLKNKDRLDREWEGLCTYEADPSNTNIANDPANIRKNRYSDTVPCKYAKKSNICNIPARIATATPCTVSMLKSQTFLTSWKNRYSDTVPCKYTKKSNISKILQESLQQHQTL